MVGDRGRRRLLLGAENALVERISLHPAVAADLSNESPGIVAAGTVPRAWGGAQQCAHASKASVSQPLMPSLTWPLASLKTHKIAVPTRK